MEAGAAPQMSLAPDESKEQDMGYLEFTAGAGGAATLERAPMVLPAALTPAPVDTPRSFSPPPAALSELEWSVVGIAARDRLSTLRRAATSRLSKLLFGERPNPRLADPKLEALRRIAVLSWHHGYTIPSAEVRAFLAAGFSADQYEIVVDRIADSRARQAARRFNR